MDLAKLCLCKRSETFTLRIRYTEISAPRSIIADSIQKELRERDGIVCLDFYFTEGEDNHVSIARILATLLTQLLRKTKAPAAALREKLGTCAQRSTPLNFTEYLDLIKAQAATIKTVYLIIDGLDFYQHVPKEDTRQQLGKSLRELPESFRILFTSRDDSSIGRELGVDRGWSIEPTKQDLVTYVRGRIKSDRVLSSVLEHPRDREAVINKVTEMALSCKMLVLPHYTLTAPKKGKKNERY